MLKMLNLFVCVSEVDRQISVTSRKGEEYLSVRYSMNLLIFNKIVRINFDLIFSFI